MGYLKRIERSSKRVLMHAAAHIVRTEKLSPHRVIQSNPKRILIIRQHNQMGDMILAIPALRAIKQSYPETEIGIITSTINHDVLLNNPYVDHLFAYRKKNIFGIPGFVMAIRRKRFDLVIVLNTVSFSFTSALLALISGASIRAGSTSQPFGTAIGASFYHLELPLPSESELLEMNETEHNLYPLKILGFETNDLSPLLVPPPKSEDWAERFVSTHWVPEHLRLVVHPGAGKKENIWAPEKFASVVDRLSNVKPIDLVILMGPRDAEPVNAFSRSASVSGEVLRGRTIGDAASIMKRADLVLCNDTGTMHVACAVGAPTIAVFGPTNPKRWAPKCRNLYAVRAPEGRLDLLSAETVYEKALEVLESSILGSV